MHLNIKGSGMKKMLKLKEQKRKIKMEMKMIIIR